MTLSALPSRFRARYREIAATAPAFKGPRAYLNWALANYELLTRSSKIRARPLKLTFDPTNVCQLRCPLCPTGLQIQDRDKGHTQTHIFQHLMDEVGDYVFFLDFYNWGEPLLNPRTEELIEIATKKRVVTNMSSNLSLPLSDERLRRLVSSGLGQLVVSLDGASQETYSVYRRLGKFDLVYGNMARIVKMRRALGLTRPRVTWQFLVFKFNEHEMDKARQLADEAGIDTLTFRAPFLDEQRFPLSDADKSEIATWNARSPEFNRYHPAHPDHLDQSAPLPEKLRCGWHYMSTAINWDGSVAPCCTVFEKKDDFGMLGKEAASSYMQVVNNESFRAVRDSFAGRGKTKPDLICERCPTPSLMSYHKHLNGQILLHTVVQALEVLRHFGPTRGLAARSGGASRPDAAAS